MKSVSLLKLSGILINFGLLWVCGTLPLGSDKFRKNPKLIGYANAFSGGLFLSVGIIHLLGEGAESFEEYYLKKDSEFEIEHYPWPNIITVLAFTFFLALDKVFLSDLHNKVGIEQEDESPTKRLELMEMVPAGPQPQNQSLETTINKEENKNRNKSKSSLTPHILNLAMGIHSIFEGIAIGLALSFKSTFALVVAVIGHKWASGLALGTSYFDSQVPISQANKLIFVQALMTPFGIGVGWAFSFSGDLIRGIFSCLAGGTFLYVGTIEMISNEFEKKGNKYKKLFLYLFAMILVSLLPLLEELDE